jgi:hypothetical protein
MSDVTPQIPEFGWLPAFDLWAAASLRKPIDTSLPGPLDRECALAGLGILVGRSQSCRIYPFGSSKQALTAGLFSEKV